MAHIDDATRWSSVAERFSAWQSLHGVAYGGAEERLKRMAIFEKTAAHVDARNAQHDRGEITHMLTLNRFSDLTNEEFRVRNGLRRASGSGAAAVRAPLFKPGATRGQSWDWRDQHNNVITEVKDQGQCGSCWAFSTTGSIEAAAALANESFAGWYETSIPRGFSEKEIVDCAPPPNEGCMGGYMDLAMEWISRNSSGDGINSERSYSYHPYGERCDFRKERVSVVSIEGHEKVPVSSPAMIAALSRQPVSIGIDASSPDFQNYARGVYRECAHTAERIDHGVLAVGYHLDRRDNHTGYIIVKNSWGGSWGQDGYINIGYDASLDNGTCGMNLQAVVPVGARMHAPTPTPPPPPLCAKRTLLSPAFYCDYNTTCCCAKQSIFGTCKSYTCCPSAAACTAPTVEGADGMVEEPQDDDAPKCAAARADATGVWW